LVIDGQQRLTTITLLLLAIIHFLESKKDPSPELERLQKVIHSLIFDDESLSLQPRVKLKPNKSDAAYFDQIIHKKIKMDDSNIVLNYRYFYGIVSEYAHLAEILEVFQKMTIVSIDLDGNQDDPQKIFESLNSTGVDLTDADLIRNFILMNHPTDTQEHLHQHYWVQLEKLTGDLAEFVRVFLMFRLGKNVTLKKRSVYQEFQKWSSTLDTNSSKEILQELIKYAEFYSYFVQNRSHPNTEIQQRLERLERLEFKVSHPFLLFLFDELHSQKISSSEVVYALAMIESLAFRKIMVSSTTQGLNKMFISLRKEIQKAVQERLDQNWKENFDEILFNKSSSQKFPTDQEFTEALMHRDVYHFRAKNRDFLLHSLENYSSAYTVDTSDLTVEHIMPQTLTNQWKITLGENWKNVHQKYLHTLGNLTLTAHNAALSNKSFEEKIALDTQSSKLRLNIQRDETKLWGEESIRYRAEKFAQDAIVIWPYPKVKERNQQSPEKFDTEIISVSSAENVQGRKPSKLIVELQNFEVEHWWQIKTELSKHFFESSPTQMKEIIKSSMLSRYFANESGKDGLRTPAEFWHGYYVESHGSSQDVLRFANRLCLLFGVNPSDVNIEIQV